MARQPSQPPFLWFGPALAGVLSFGGVMLLGGALLMVMEGRRPPSPPSPAPLDASETANSVALEPERTRLEDPIAPSRSSETIRRAFQGPADEEEGFPGLAATRVRAKPALWKLADGDTTIYLFGTIHLLRPGLDWFGADLQRAFTAANELVIEAIETDPRQAAGQLFARAIDRDGPPLSQKLAPDAARRYRATMQRFGLPIKEFESLEPWFVTMFLSNIMLQQFGYGPGVDEALVERALATGKPVIPLETMDFQLSIFDQMPERTQIKLLNETIQGLDQPPKALEHITHLWATGQPEALATDLEETARVMPGHYNALITKRNRRWTEWLVDRLERPGTVFVAVGAAHFAGEDSVLRMLRARQFRVTRVR